MDWNHTAKSIFPVNTIQTQSVELNTVQHYRVKSLVDSFKISVFQVADLHLLSDSLGQKNPIRLSVLWLQSAWWSLAGVRLTFPLQYIKPNKRCFSRPLQLHKETVFKLFQTSPPVCTPSTKHTNTFPNPMWLLRAKLHAISGNMPWATLSLIYSCLSKLRLPSYRSFPFKSDIIVSEYFLWALKVCSWSRKCVTATPNTILWLDFKHK